MPSAGVASSTDFTFSPVHSNRCGASAARELMHFSTDKGRRVMNSKCKMTLAVLAGAALGAAAIQALHAQAKPPVYAVVDISEITDPEGFKALGGRSNEAAATVFKELGARYIARGGKITALDGTPPTRFVIIAFDSTEKAQAWNNSPAQKEVNAIRVKTTKSRVFIVEGM